MSKLSEIKAAQLAARKNKEKLKATLLTTVIGEAEIVGKNNGNRETTDAEVLVVLKKFEKGLNETIGYLREAHKFEAATTACDELAILLEFTPVKLADLQLQKDIGIIMQEQNLPKEQKSLGIIVKVLKDKYSEQFDGQQVSRIFKEMLI